MSLVSSLQSTQFDWEGFPFVCCPSRLNSISTLFLQIGNATQFSIFHRSPSTVVKLQAIKIRILQTENFSMNAAVAIHLSLA